MAGSTLDDILSRPEIHRIKEDLRLGVPEAEYGELHGRLARHGLARAEVKDALLSAGLPVDAVRRLSLGGKSAELAKATSASMVVRDALRLASKFGTVGVVELEHLESQLRRAFDILEAARAEAAEAEKELGGWQPQADSRWREVGEDGAFSYFEPSQIAVKEPSGGRPRAGLRLRLEPWRNSGESKPPTKKPRSA